MELKNSTQSVKTLAIYSILIFNFVYLFNKKTRVKNIKKVLILKWFFFFSRFADLVSIGDKVLVKDDDDELIPTDVTSVLTFRMQG